MNIQNKIEEIRRKPEHIRVRYAWGLSIAITFFVVILWFVSLSSQKETADETATDDSQEAIFQDLGNQKQSLDEITGQMKDSVNNLKQAGNAPSTLQGGGSRDNSAPDDSLYNSNSTSDSSLDGSSASDADNSDEGFGQ